MPNQPKKTGARGLRLEQLSMVGMLVGSVISFFTTYYGMKALMGTTGVTDHMSQLIALGVTFMIQLAILVAVIKIRRNSFTQKLPFILIYVVAVFFSVSFATGFWVHVLEGANLAEASAVGPFSAVDRSIRSYVNSYGDVSEWMDSLAVYSKSMEELERTEGTSCGYQTGAVEGPRSHMRESDATTIGIAGAELKRSAGRLRQELGEFEQLRENFNPRSAAAAERQLKGILDRCWAERSSSGLTQALDYLKMRTDGNGMRIEWDGVVFDCPDPVFQSLAENVISRIEALPEIPSPESIHFFDGDNASDAVVLVFEVALSKVTGLVSGVTPPNRPQMHAERADEIRNGPSEAAQPKLPVYPFLFGLLTDLLIFISGMTTSQRDGFFSGGGSAVADSLGNEIMAEVPSQEMGDLLREFIWKYSTNRMSLYRILCESIDDSRRVVILREKHNESSGLLQSFMDLLSLKGLASPASVEGGWLRRAFVNETDEPEDQVVKVWLLSRSLSPERLRTAVRILEEKPGPIPVATRAA